MNADQQAIVLEGNAELQRAAAQLQQLLVDASAGCEQLVAQNERDLLPLENALNAVRKQVGEIVVDANRWCDCAYERSRALGPSEDARAQLERARRDFERWAQQAWMHCSARLFVLQFRAMWPHVHFAAAQNRPAPARQDGPTPGSRGGIWIAITPPRSDRGPRRGRTKAPVARTHRSSQRGLVVAQRVEESAAVLRRAQRGALDADGVALVT